VCGADLYLTEESLEMKGRGHLQAHVTAGEHAVDSVVEISSDDSCDEPVVLDEHDAGSVGDKCDGDDSCDLPVTESRKCTTHTAIPSDGSHAEGAHDPSTQCVCGTDLHLTEESHEMKGRGRLQAHVTAGEHVVDSVIEISSDDSCSDPDPDPEGRKGVRSPDMYVFESCNLHDIERMKVTTHTAIPSCGSHIERANHPRTQNVCGAEAIAQGNRHFTCSPDWHTVYVKKPVAADVPCQEEVGSSCSDDPTVVNSITCNFSSFSGHITEAESVCCPDSEPASVSGLSEPEVSSSCDRKPLVVTGTGRDLVDVNNSKLVTGSGESVSVNCVRRDSVPATSSGVKSLISCSTTTSRELVTYNSSCSDHAFVCSNGEASSTEHLLTARENVLDPVDVGGCGETPQRTHDLGKEPVVADTLDGGPKAVARSSTQPEFVEMSDEGPLVISSSGVGPVDVDKFARKIALDEQCGIGDEDRKLAPLSEEGLSRPTAIIISHAVSTTTDTVHVNEEAISHTTVTNNTENHTCTTGTFNGSAYTSTSAKDRKVGEPVTSYQLIAACQAMLYNHHDTAATRLQLGWAPFCCQYPFSCTQRHKSSHVSGALYHILNFIISHTHTDIYI
jgi:hypothetical protein